MPAQRRSQPATSDAGSDDRALDDRGSDAPDAPDASGTPESAPAPAAEHAEPDQAADALDEVPLNRAERRARERGRGKSTAPAPERGRIAGGKGPAPSKRMWANRRSGS